MTRIALLIISSLNTISLFAQPLNNWANEKIMVKKEKNVSTIMHAESIFQDRWDMQPQPQFWKQIMLLSPDSCLVNVASNRVVLKKMSIKDWNAQTEELKSQLKTKLKNEFGIDQNEGRL
jgi:hypothetical protein